MNLGKQNYKEVKIERTDISNEEFLVWSDYLLTSLTIPFFPAESS